MIEDPIVSEMRKYRDSLAAKHGHNLRKIAESLRKREQESGRPVVDPGPKRRLNQTGS